MVALLDTNVIIDFLSKRPGFEQARDIIDLSLNGNVDCVMAAHSVINIFYILRKNVKPDVLRSIMLDMIAAVPVVDVTAEVIRSALQRTSFSDFEDCIQDECAKAIVADYIVTRNVGDFHDSKIPVVTPEAFLAHVKR